MTSPQTVIREVFMTNTYTFSVLSFESIRSFASLAFATSAIATAMCTTACSVGAGDGGNPLPAVPHESFDNKVAGPALEGSWSSACKADFGTQFRQLKINFTGQKVIRSDNAYNDPNCLQLAYKSEQRGVYRYAANTPYNGFAVDYQFNIGNGVTQITGEELLLENNQLYLSQFKNGFGSIDKSYPMTNDQ